MKHLTSQTKHSLLSLALMAAFIAPAAYAATITAVPAVADEAVDSDVKCSLREAVLSVNAGTNQGGCVADITEAYGTNDTITLQAGIYRLALGGLDETENTGTIPATVNNIPDASMGDLDLLKSAGIIGAGSGNTRIEWDPAATTSTTADRIFHVYTTNAATANVDVVMQGVTLASGKTFQVDLGADSVTPTLHYYLRRAGGALALGAAANVVTIDTTLSGSANANAGGLGGSTGGESGATAYTLVLTDVIVDGNSAQGDGGGAYIAAQTTATNLVLSNNTSTTNGGGLYNEANTSIANSTISGNTSEGGGGLFGTGSNTVVINGVTFSGNTAVGGGAISSRSGVLINIVNSTISGNTGSDVGGGLYTNGAVNLNFVTIAKNISGADSSTAGSGINTFPSGGGDIKLNNVLLEGNVRGSDPLARVAANCGGTGNAVTVTSQGHNLSSDTTCNSLAYLWLDDTTDKSNVDPKIGALANNGGPTQTHALLTSSPALGTGVAVVGVTVDQRGVTRDAIPDIGAYEVPTPPAPASSDDGGGCTFNPTAAFDPSLLALLGIALGGVFLRRRRQVAVQR